MPASAAKTILVVEDNAITREGPGVILADAGHAVVLAEDGRRALELLRTGSAPDLILLDMLMPVLDGWHFLQQLKGQPHLKAVPIIIVTGTILTTEWAQAHGCAGFVPKPVDPAMLLEEIRRCLA